MALTKEQWKEILSAVKFNSNQDGALEQIKVKLKEQYQDIYQEWEQRCFDVNHLFNISLSIQDYKTQKYTLLHIATLNSHLDTVKYLAGKEKADINKADQDDGNTALHLAALNGNLEIVKYFVDEKKADVNKADYYGNTVLHLAADGGHLDIVKYLAGFVA